MLPRQSERIIAQAHPFDDVIRGSPRFNVEPVGKAIDRLMVRAVDLFKSVCGDTIVAKGLNIVIA
ncbi:MAG: hypothetical protein ACR2MF_04820, partial [Chthoniobacterales bacterium]